MRDIALSLIIFGLLPLVFKHPRIGALLWAWVSLMNPHRLTYGFAYSFPFAAVIAAATLVGTAISKERRAFPRSLISVLLIAFVVWMSITSLFAMGPPEETYAEWEFVVKIHLMLLVTLMLIRGRNHIDQLIWVMVISIGFYGFKGGIFTLTTSGGSRVWGPPGSVIEGNNELAVALVMLLPLIYYLSATAKHNLVKYGLLVVLGSCALSIFGSQSRGAFLAILAAVAMLVLKGRRPFLIGTLALLTLPAVIAFMPDNWVARMQTIEAPTEEESANSRLLTWRTLWNMALDRPLVGAGFNTEISEVFTRYSPVEGLREYSPHSIYFQALGEHGFVGLGLFLSIVFVTWRRASMLARVAKDQPDLEWAGLLARMSQVSLVGFLVGGAFLNLLHFDMAYYIVALVVLVEATLRDQGRLVAPAWHWRHAPPAPLPATVPPERAPK